MVSSTALSEEVKKVIHIAQSISKEYNHENFSAAHLLKALLHKSIGLHGFLDQLPSQVQMMQQEPFLKKLRY
jgi:ATP-dependent Clp protease ATP-binding subunit ClpB